MSQKSRDVLKRVDDLLAMGPDDPARPEILDDPPRKLLSSTQVLQVVNTHVSFVHLSILDQHIADRDVDRKRSLLVPL